VVKGFWGWWSPHETTTLSIALLANALMGIGAAWFLPPEQGAVAVVSAFLLLVAWGILSAVADFKYKAQREHDFEHLLDGRGTPPMPEAVQAELDRIEWLQRAYDRIDRERDDQ
jgi:hypothetical protein